MTTPGFEPIDHETPDVNWSEFDDSINHLIWGRHSGVSTFRRVPTPEEQLVKSVSRGGFPLLRRDPCQRLPAPLGSSVHTAISRILATGAKIRPRM